MEFLIKKQIFDSPRGFITYADFIDTVLYHREFGYYMKDGIKIGREGDFFTTSNVSDIYGRMVAKWYSQLALKFSLPTNVCEIGAGTGRFAQAFIEEWDKCATLKLSYTMVETSPYHRRLQQEKIVMNENVKQVKNLDEVNSFEGLIFSNELFDALPVHVVQRLDNELFEMMVTVQNDQLVEIPVQLENEKIIEFLSTQNLVLQESQRIEVPLAMTNLIGSISNILTKGIILTVDYGYTNKEWMDPIHRNGSLRGYYRHQLINDILQHFGDMDITSHVHFDALIEMGENSGLSFIDKLRQDEFFLSIGILNELQNHYDSNPFSEKSKQNRAIRSLIMPSGLSPSFQAVLQHKGLQDQASQILMKKWI
ncbi:class I SAM-dependent methyltransferase [Bacillus sp. 1NLA3E]|uniref:class I SAM-dependent methyltransferase n=1 Tax=Bacillus sp. 1NLA3E TaxID=666686 RepID=UPI000247E70C|nr:SAM-dependent methyltransferase [Bacillus sp. 1NLA3E]AGK54905.1 hypothetical protein B1NLA3E_15795 [Bacillus sp. 1NLA3E]